MNSIELCKEHVETLRQSRAFLVVRELFPPWSYEKDPFPAEEYGFTVVPGVGFSGKIADIAQERASAKTTALGVIDDLYDIGFFEPNSLKANLYRFIHSLEHLTVIDLMARGIVQLPIGIEYSAAITITYGRTDEKSVDGHGFSFFIRRGIARDEEQDKSVSNAIAEVNSLVASS